MTQASKGAYSALFGAHIPLDDSADGRKGLLFRLVVYFINLNSPDFEDVLPGVTWHPSLRFQQLDTNQDGFLGRSELTVATAQELKLFDFRRPFWEPGAAPWPGGTCATGQDRTQGNLQNEQNFQERRFKIGVRVFAITTSCLYEIYIIYS